MHFRPGMLVVIITLMVMAPSRAGTAAEPDEQTRREARELVYQGDELFARRNFVEALKAYERAEELVRAPTTSIEVARTLAALGRLTDARKLVATIALSPASPAEPAPFAKARRDAEALRAELDGRIPWLRITLVPSPSDAKTRIDGQAVKPSNWGSPLDPGNHWIEVEATGYQPIRTRIHVPEKRLIDMKVPLTPAPHATRGTSPWAIGSFVSAGVGLTMGIAMGAVYLNARNDLDDACRQRTGNCSEHARDKLNYLGWISNVGFGLALTGAAVGGLIVGMEGTRAPPAHLAWTLGPAYLGVRGTL